MTFPGDLTDEEAIMDFLASPEALELEDQIEEVNAKQLYKLVQENQFVAVFFCEWTLSFFGMSLWVKAFLQLQKAYNNNLTAQSLVDQSLRRLSYGLPLAFTCLVQIVIAW